MSIKEAEKIVIDGLEDRSNIPVRFFYRSIKNEETGKFENVEYLEKLIDRLNVRHLRAKDEHRKMYFKQYQAFKANEEQKEDGTPIDYLPAITPAQKDNLEQCHVYTIERLAECGHSVLDSIGYGGAELQKRAQEYLQQSSTGNEELKALKAEIEQLKQELKEKGNEPSNSSPKRSGRNSSNTKASSSSDK